MQSFFFSFCCSSSFSALSVTISDGRRVKRAKTISSNTDHALSTMSTAHVQRTVPNHTTRSVGQIVSRTAERLLFRQRIDVPSPFSPHSVLEHHQRLRNRISSQPNHDELVFFKNEDRNHREMNRPVLLRSSSHGYTEKESLEHDDRPNVYLTEMKANRVFHGRQLSVWIVTPAALTTMLDGTIYLTVRDAFHFHIRLGKSVFAEASQ